LLDDPGSAAQKIADTNRPHFCFNLHESAKSSSYLSDLATVPAEKPDSVPDSLMTREAMLIAQAKQYRKMEDAVSEVYRSEQLLAIDQELNACWTEMKPYAPGYVRFRSGESYTYTEMQEVLDNAAIKSVAFVSFFCDEHSTTAFVFRPGQQSPKVFKSALGTSHINSVAQQISRIFNGSPESFPPYPPIIRDQPEKRSLAFFDAIGQQLLSFLPAIENSELICIAPHGPLHLIPLHALRLPDGNFFAKRYAVVYTPSLSVLMSLLTLQRPPLKSRPQVLVAGVAAESDIHPEYFEHDLAIFDSQECQLTAKSGIKAASKKAVLEAIPGKDLIHLSCHGYFNHRDPLSSGLLFSDGNTQPPRNPATVPFMKRNSFLITTRDLSTANLRAHLVTLNACSSGVQGQRNAGDEMDGFNRSLLLSGSAAVLSTLWNVDQESSGQFFTFFYRQWLNSGKTIEKWRAFHHAQLNFINNNQRYLQHPYHWAAFTLTGNWK
jgi:CHAT domain-containing protein